MHLHKAVIATVACAVSACGGPSGPSAGQPPATRGAQLYATHCGACHQRDGRRLGESQPALVGSATVAGEAQPLIAWVLFGRRPATLQATRSVVVMPQFAWLSDEDVAAVLTHVRSNFGHAQPAIGAVEVAAVRAAGRVP
jgi:mono/diheme cytochrome c family protein